MKITWKRVKDCDGYRIYVRKPGSSKYVLLKTVNSSQTVAYTSKKLTDGGKYRIKIKTFVLSEKKKIYSDYSSAKVFRL